MTHYYRHDAGSYHPTHAARSPWDHAAQNGVAIGGLLAHLIATACDGSAMAVTRLIIDLEGAVPFAPLEASVALVRPGRRMQRLEATLTAGGRIVARASALLLRETDSPAWHVATVWPAPETLGPSLPSSNPKIGFAIHKRPAAGLDGNIGPGAQWVRFDLGIVAGHALRPLEMAAMLGDFGSGTGPVVQRSEWSYANLDIAIHFLRMPVGAWLLIDAVSESSGNGIGIASSILADRDGPFARAHQTLFLEKRVT